MAKTPEQDRIAAEGAERRRQALDLRKRGHTFDEIGRHFGVSKQRAHKMVSKELARIPKQEADELRAQELEKCDRRERVLDEVFASCAVLEVFEEKDDAGKVTRTRTIPIDAENAIEAAKALIKNSERRARIQGLDAPTKHDANLKFDPTAITPAKAREVMAELFGAVTPVADEDDGRAGEPDPSPAGEGTPDE